MAYIREIGEQHGYRKGFLRQILMEIKRSVKGAGEEREWPRRECVRFVPVLFHLKNGEGSGKKKRSVHGA